MSSRSRQGRRAFRPNWDGRLEDRELLSTGQAEVSRIADQMLAARHDGAGPVSTRRATAVPRQDGPREHLKPIQTFVRGGGKGVRVIDGQGDIFDVIITGTGTVRARPTRDHDGRVDLILSGTTSDSIVTISPAALHQEPGKAHTFNPAFGSGDELLNVRAIQVRSGRIGQILGFRTVNLSGPIDVRGESAVDRIALNRILPGGSITVTNDLNTLDVFVNANFAGSGTGLFVGRDLNWMNVRGDLTFTDGATAGIARDLGLRAQPQKGTGAGGQGLQVQGNFNIASGSTFVIERNLAGPLVVQGNFTGTSRFIVRGFVTSGVQVLGTVSPT